MTKLLEWLCGVSVYFAVWTSLIAGRVKSKFLDDWMDYIKILPIFTVGLIGVSCLTLVLWRVYNFNDCKEAAGELQNEIKMAKEDLKTKGLEL